MAYVMSLSSRAICACTRCGAISPASSMEHTAIRFTFLPPLGGPKAAGSVLAGRESRWARGLAEHGRIVQVFEQVAVRRDLADGANRKDGPREYHGASLVQPDECATGFERLEAIRVSAGPAELRGRPNGTLRAEIVRERRSVTARFLVAVDLE